MCRTPVIDAPAEYISLNHLQMVTRHLSLTILHASPMLMPVVVRFPFLFSILFFMIRRRE